MYMSRDFFFKWGFHKVEASSKCFKCMSSSPMAEGENDEGGQLPSMKY